MIRVIQISSKFQRINDIPTMASPFFAQTRATRNAKSTHPLTLKEKLNKHDKSSETPPPAPENPQMIVAKKTVQKKSLKKKDVNVTDPVTDPKQSKWEPKHWEEVMEKLREMRKARPAPVDTMGCHMCSDEKATPKEKRFHILIALMLSSQTKDEVTFEAMKRLRDHGLTPGNIVKTPPEELEDILKPVGFYKTKAKYLIKTCDVLEKQYGGDIPNTVQDLIKLPGVGPKMAHICMNSAWGIVTGIGVDTHVHRISNRLKWVPKETKDPEKTRLELEKWVPQKHWSEVNVLLVGFGQTICTPTHPKCKECSLSKLCPSSTV